MQLHIQHETRYRYERPVKYSVQSLHLTPRRDPCQRALTWTITAPGRRLEQIDAHGNISHLLTIEQPHREIEGNPQIHAKQKRCVEKRDKRHESQRRH